MNLEEYKYKNLTPFKFFVLQEFPYIEEDFDSITNYQLMCKIAGKLKEVVNSTNEIGQEMEKLVEYIDNLDFTEEIDAKLDEMVEDGIFDEIINQEIFGELNTKIDNRVKYFKVNNTYTKAQLQEILNTTGEKVIEFENGTYNYDVNEKIDRLTINSNTTLIFNNAVINSNGLLNGVLFLTYELDSTYTGYNGNENIKIIGGNFNCGFALMHNKNVEFNGCTFTNPNNQHAIQIAGCLNTKIVNCRFNGSKYDESKKTESEVIQFDMCIQANQPYLLDTTSVSYDNTINTNIYINNNIFYSGNGTTNKMYTAIGSHTGYYENERYFNFGVVISNNIFYAPSYATCNLTGCNNLKFTNNFSFKSSTTDEDGTAHIMTFYSNNNMKFNNNVFGYGKGLHHILTKDGFLTQAGIYFEENYIYNITPDDTNPTSHYSLIYAMKTNGLLIKNNVIDNSTINLVDFRNQGDVKNNYCKIINNVFTTNNLNANQEFVNIGYSNNTTIMNNHIYIGTSGRVAIATTTDSTNYKIMNNTFNNPRRMFNTDFIMTKNVLHNTAIIPEILSGSYTDVDNQSFKNDITNLHKLILEIGTLTSNAQHIEILPWFATDYNFDLTYSPQYQFIVTDGTDIVIGKFKINLDGTYKYECPVPLRTIFSDNN